MKLTLTRCSCGGWTVNNAPCPKTPAPRRAPERVDAPLRASAPNPEPSGTRGASEVRAPDEASGHGGTDAHGPAVAASSQGATAIPEPAHT